MEFQRFIQEKSFTPVKLIVRNPEIRPSTSQDAHQPNEPSEILIQQQIRSLQEEVGFCDFNIYANTEEE